MSSIAIAKKRIYNFGQRRRETNEKNQGFIDAGSLLNPDGKPDAGARGFVQDRRQSDR
jgi:hypothetical protein